MTIQSWLLIPMFSYIEGDPFDEAVRSVAPWVLVACVVVYALRQAYLWHLRRLSAPKQAPEAPERQANDERSK